jgi:putative transposase
MMLDQGVVSVSPMTVYRVLKSAGLMEKKNSKPSKKGTGFIQPLAPHDHWHIDVSYINIAGTFYYLCSVLDGYSRYILHWEIRESMKESEIELIIQKAREKFPGANPRIISDNGPQFISKDFKEFIRICGMTHVRTSPYYPQSNGKLERWHREYKETVIRPKTPRTAEEAREMTLEWINYYNNVRLHSALSYIAPIDQLEGREQEIHDRRDAKLESAREQRRTNRRRATEQNIQPPTIDLQSEGDYNRNISSEDRALLGSNPSADRCRISIEVSGVPQEQAEMLFGPCA